MFHYLIPHAYLPPVLGLAPRENAGHDAAQVAVEGAGDDAVDQVDAEAI